MSDPISTHAQAAAEWFRRAYMTAVPDSPSKLCEEACQRAVTATLAEKEQECAELRELLENASNQDLLLRALNRETVEEREALKRRVKELEHSHSTLAFVHKLQEIEKLRRDIAKLERQYEEAVGEREAWEQFGSHAFYLIVGSSPEWSNLFGMNEATEEIDDAQITLRLALSAEIADRDQLRYELDEAYALMAEGGRALQLRDALCAEQENAISLLQADIAQYQKRAEKLVSACEYIQADHGMTKAPDRCDCPLCRALADYTSTERTSDTPCATDAHALTTESAEGKQAKAAPSTVASTEPPTFDPAAAQRPIIVCLCGSSRHPELHMKEMMRLTLEGKIVVPMGLYGHADFPKGARQATNDGDESMPVKQMLDRLHFAKIDISDEVHIITVGGYIGSSTSREKEYAIKYGKRIVMKDFHEARTTECPACKRLVEALAITQRTAFGWFELGWNIQVTGHEMNAIRNALAAHKEGKTV